MGTEPTPERAAFMAGVIEVQQQWDEAENTLLEHAPEHYDGDTSQTEIVLRYVRDLEALRDATAAYFDNPMEVTVNPVLAALDVCLGRDPDERAENRCD